MFHCWKKVFINKVKKLIYTLVTCNTYKNSNGKIQQSDKSHWSKKHNLHKHIQEDDFAFCL